MVYIIKSMTSTWCQALHIPGIFQCFIIVPKIQEGQKSLGEGEVKIFNLDKLQLFRQK